ncbi:hypothetical protein ACLOAV_007945 [Pseudogymnoascus australis]
MSIPRSGDLVPSPLNPPRHLTNRGNSGGFVALSGAKATAGTTTLICWYAAKGYPCYHGKGHGSPEVRRLLSDHFRSKKSPNHHLLFEENSQNSAGQRVTPNQNAPQDRTEVHLECKGKIQVPYTTSEDMSGNRKKNSAVQRVTPNQNAPQDSIEAYLECKGKIQVSYTISEDMSGNRKKNILSRISKKKRDSRDVRLRIGSSYADRWNLRGRREPVQIPDEPSDGGEGTGASTNPPRVKRHGIPPLPRPQRRKSQLRRRPPSPDPSASALLSAGASGPPNPFARPHPPNQGGGPPSGGRRGGGNGNEIETPVGALPSRFMTNELLPGPSSLYPEWNFRGGDGNTGYNSGAASSSSVSPHAASRASPQAHPYLYRASQQNPGPKNQQMNQLGQGNLQPPNDPRLVAAMNQQAGGNGQNAGIIFPANMTQEQRQTLTTVPAGKVKDVMKALNEQRVPSRQQFRPTGQIPGNGQMVLSNYGFQQHIAQMDLKRQQLMQQQLAKKRLLQQQVPPGQQLTPPQVLQLMEQQQRMARQMASQQQLQMQQQQQQQQLKRLDVIRRKPRRQ